MRRRLVCVTTIALVCLVLLQPTSAMASPCWRTPVRGTVVDPFRAPSCPYCAGSRGIEYAVSRSTAVRAVAAGTVTYSGTVVGVMYVVVRHANGWKITYGKLTSSNLRRGDRVVARSLIGRATGRMHFGLRIGGAYRDPAPYLGRVVGQPRLVPVDGSRQRSAATTGVALQRLRAPSWCNERWCVEMPSGAAIIAPVDSSESTPNHCLDGQVSGRPT